jgi:hypothetical protein
LSRYDREAAFFDALGEFDRRHPALGFVTAWLIAVGVFTLSFIGPFVGTFVYDWLLGLDPDNGWQIAAAWFGGSAVLATGLFAVAALWPKGGRA